MRKCHHGVRQRGFPDGSSLLDGGRLCPQSFGLRRARHPGRSWGIEHPPKFPANIPHPRAASQCGEPQASADLGPSGSGRRPHHPGRLSRNRAAHHLPLRPPPSIPIASVLSHLGRTPIRSGRWWHDKSSLNTPAGSGAGKGVGPAGSNVFPRSLETGNRSERLSPSFSSFLTLPFQFRVGDLLHGWPQVTNRDFQSRAS